MYMEALDNLRTRKVIKKAQTTPTDSEMEQQAKDYYANVRTNVSRFVIVLFVFSADRRQTRSFFFGYCQMYVIVSGFLIERFTNIMLPGCSRDCCS